MIPEGKHWQNQYCFVCFVHKRTYLWSVRSSEGGELSLSVCPGVGTRGFAGIKRGEGTVKRRIEPCPNFWKVSTNK